MDQSATVTLVLAIVGWVIVVERRLSRLTAVAESNAKSIDGLAKQVQPISEALGYARQRRPIDP